MEVSLDLLVGGILQSFGARNDELGLTSRWMLQVLPNYKGMMAAL